MANKTNRFISIVILLYVIHSMLFYVLICVLLDEPFVL
jgi:hypothetical protein